MGSLQFFGPTAGAWGEEPDEGRVAPHRDARLTTVYNKPKSTHLFFVVCTLFYVGLYTTLVGVYANRTSAGAHRDPGLTSWVGCRVARGIRALPELLPVLWYLLRRHHARFLPHPGKQCVPLALVPPTLMCLHGLVADVLVFVPTAVRRRASSQHRPLGSGRSWRYVPRVTANVPRAT